MWDFVIYDPLADNVQKTIIKTIMKYENDPIRFSEKRTCFILDL